MTRSLFAWQPHGEGLNSLSSPPECSLSSVIYSVKAAHTGRDDWHLLTNSTIPPLMSITTKCYLSRRSYVWLIWTVPAGRNRRENRFSEHQRVLPSLLLDEMSVSRSTAGDAVRWVTEGSVVTFLRPKYGIFWCRSIASILDPSPSVPIWLMMSQLVCILLWENDEKKDPERLPGNCQHQWFPIKKTGSFMNYPQIMMASKIYPPVQPVVTSELFGAIDRIWWVP